MPKRKRSEASLHEKLEKSREDVSRALKLAKGFERQRYSKRLHEADITPDKKERLEREITVLKSLDLHQTAQAHLYSSLLKVKSIAASTDLPDEIRAGVPKPELSEQERVALHNVTSGLYNRPNVKQAIERAIAGVCEILNVPVPEKGKRVRKSKIEAKEETEAQAEKETTPPAEEKPAEVEGEWDDESEFEGFSSDVDEPGPAVGEADSEAEADEESEISKYDHLLGASSDEEDDFDEELLEKYRGKETVNLDDISVSGSASEEESGAESDEESEGSAESAGESSPPAKKTKSSGEDKKKKKAKATAPARDSTFLPSLMGGYISGSESASDIDVAPPKKRRGQRARQAIWEKKYGTKAKHLQNEKQKGKGGRDQGWDMRRGAVDGDDGGRRTPWKKGIRNPLTGSNDTPLTNERRPEPKPTKRDDEGPLHPSWAARKKAKESIQTAAFAGSKITFD